MMKVDQNLGPFSHAKGHCGLSLLINTMNLSLHLSRHERWLRRVCVTGCGVRQTCLVSRSTRTTPLGKCNYTTCCTSRTASSWLQHNVSTSIELHRILPGR